MTTDHGFGAVESREHYCTMFDSSFLPMGLALYESLSRQSPGSTFWVVCLDGTTELALKTLRLPHLSTIRLEDIETNELREVRAERTPREYYWTLTPSMFEAVFDRASSASRVTYLDADLYFFRSPAVILGEMTPAHSVTITHHAYAPEYQHHAITSGEFCVQFITITRTPEARAVVAWWRDRCLEWCYDRCEDNRFGDQRYLDSWPAMLGERLLIIDRPEWTGGPWNACLADRRSERQWIPVFYHFHGFRYLSGDRALLFPLNYRVGERSRWLYREYIAAIRRSTRLVRRAGVTITGVPTPAGLEDFDPWPTIFRRLCRLVRRRLPSPVPKPIVSIR